ncbi:unnamed protein product, partial [Thlaspi arvense]
MDDQNHTTSFTLEINNFPGKETVISPNFLSGGCEWYLNVRFPKRDRINDHMYMYLYVGNPDSLRLGWKIRASYSFLVLNQSLEELHRCGGGSVPIVLRSLTRMGLMASVTKLFHEHPDLAKNLREKDQLVKAAYMNDLLSLIETLNKPPCTLSVTGLSKSLRELMWKKANFDGTQHAKNLKAEENKEKVKTATCAAREDWLEGVVRSWNEWRVRMSFV